MTTVPRFETMASRSVGQGSYQVRPLSSGSDESLVQLDGDLIGRKRKRDANLYDAVAGRVTTTRALDVASGSETQYQRDQRTTLRDPVLAPEEVLFRRVAAPTRYAERDIYHAQERLPDGGRHMLPDSDMLKAIHGHSSHFYAARAMADHCERTQKSIDERSMDETALLAFGILLEEAGREVLGKKGDLVFTEGLEEIDRVKLGGTGSESVRFLDASSTQSKPGRGRGQIVAKEEA
ncbi:hypothetical protein BJ170DRAFT_608601 [Xylariales sp. AK1849]|nr:hypothetical protein BJ170DRAFT_608601 [Xylariales sp. AK1849]